MGQIGTKWDKSVTSSDQIVVHCSSPKNLKKNRHVLFWVNLTYFWLKSDLPATDGGGGNPDKPLEVEEKILLPGVSAAMWLFCRDVRVGSKLDKSGTF